MDIDYWLAEHVVVVSGSVEDVTDPFGDGSTRSVSADAVVALAVRGDEGGGAQTLRLPERGDNEITIELTSDGRLSSVSHKSVGVGNKVIAAGASIVSTIAGLVVAGGSGAGLLTALSDEERHADADAGRDAGEAAAREEWKVKNPDLDAHQTAYRTLLDLTRSALLESRNRIVTGTEAEATAAVLRSNRLELLARTCTAEIERVELLYQAWRERQRTRTTRHLSYTLEVSSLPLGAPESPPTLDLLDGAVKDLWDDLGVLVSVAPAHGRRSARITGQAVGRADSGKVWWRIPRPVRLCTWRIDQHGAPRLDRVEEVSIVDKYSSVAGRELEGRLFGQADAGIIFDSMGSPTKFSSSDISAAGALAEALGSVGAKALDGIETASKMTTGLTSLADADAKRQLESLTREYDLASKRLEVKGLDATADDFARLKQLEQQVAMAKATGALSGPSEVMQLQDQLALETARKDLDAMIRARALDTELAAANAEITRLTTALNLEKARNGT